MPRTEEDGRRTGVGFDGRPVRLLPNMLERSGGGCTDSDDAPAIGKRPVQGRGSGGRQGIALSVQSDLFHSVNPDRLEGPQSDVKRKILNFNAPGFERRE